MEGVEVFSRVFLADGTEIPDESSTADWETLSISDGMEVDSTQEESYGSIADDAAAPADMGGTDLEEAISTLIWDIPEDEQELQQSLNQALVLASNAKQRARGRGRGAPGRRGRGSSPPSSSAAAPSPPSGSSMPATRSAVDARKKNSTCWVCDEKVTGSEILNVRPSPGIRGNRPFDGDVLMITWDYPAVSARTQELGSRASPDASEDLLMARLTP
eukprot:5599206-Amphidinium_carterae.3